MIWREDDDVVGDEQGQEQERLFWPNEADDVECEVILEYDDPVVGGTWFCEGREGKAGVGEGQ